MGMYTEFHFNVELPNTTPIEVLDILHFLVDAGDLPKSLPEHDLFKCTRWRSVLLSDSYYFAADTHSTLRSERNSWYLCVRSNLKNYEREIEKFVDWIMPWVDAYEGDFLGFHRYEESEDPDLIRKVKAKEEAK